MVVKYIKNKNPSSIPKKKKKNKIQFERCFIPISLTLFIIISSCVVLCCVVLCPLGTFNPRDIIIIIEIYLSFSGTHKHKTKIITSKYHTLYTIIIMKIYVDLI